MSKSLKNYRENKWRNTMTINGQKIEGSMFALYFSANVDFLEHNVLKTFCSKQCGVFNGEKYFSSQLLILEIERFYQCNAMMHS